jgi:hypothetical protein
VVFQYPEAFFEKISEALKKRLIILTHMPGYIRFAINCYNTPGQMEALMGVFRQILT